MDLIKLKNKFRIGERVILKSVKELALEFAPKEYRPGECDEFYIELLQRKIPFGFNNEMAQASGQPAIITFINNSPDKQLNICFINKEYRTQLSRWTYCEDMFKRDNSTQGSDSDEIISEVLTNFVAPEGTINEL